MDDLLNLSSKSIVLQRNALLNVYQTVDTNIYFVEEGSIKLFVIDNETEQIIRFGYPGNFIVFLDSFLSNSKTKIFLQAIKKTKLKVISKEQWEKFILEDKNKILWIEMLEKLVLQQFEREIDILTHSPKERYMRVFRRSPQLFQAIPHKYIANYLRMSPETLSRLKSLDLRQE